MEIEYIIIIIIISIEVWDWKGTRSGNDFAFGKCLKCFRIYCKKVCINGKRLGLGQNKKKGLNEFLEVWFCLRFFSETCVYDFFFKTHGVYTRLCVQLTKTTWIDMIVGTMVQCFRYVTFIGRCGSFGVFQIQMGFYLWIIVVSFISCNFWVKNRFCMCFWDPNGSLFWHNGVEFCVFPFLGHNSISYFFQIRMWVYVSIMV